VDFPRAACKKGKNSNNQPGVEAQLTGNKAANYFLNDSNSFGSTAV